MTPGFIQAEGSAPPRAPHTLSAGTAEPPDTSLLFRASPAASRALRTHSRRPGEVRRRGSRGPAVSPRLTPPLARPPALRAPSPAGACHSHVSAGHLHWLLEHFQAHGTRKAAEGVSLGRRLRRLRGPVAGIRLRRRHLAAEERRAQRKSRRGGRGRRRLRTREDQSWAESTTDPCV